LKPEAQAKKTGCYSFACASGFNNANLELLNDLMADGLNTPLDRPPHRWYRGANVPMREIRRFARQVAERFQPDKIILFGSQAYGTPHEDSDVDLLVILPAHNELDKSVKIRCDVDAPFAMDLIVIKPKNVKWRLQEGDSFLAEIMSKGKVLYEKDDPGVGAQGRGRLPSRRQDRRRKRAIS
jgi:predicted nucleotidyltransferase